MARRTVGEHWDHFLKSQADEQRPIAPVLVVTVATMLLTPILDENQVGRIVLVLLVGLAALTALARTGAGRHTRTAATIAVVVSTLAVAASPPSMYDSGAAVTEDWRQYAAQGMFTVLLLITPTVVMLRLLLRPRITLDTLAGALTAYLQIGLFFAAFYRLVDLALGGTFFGEGVETTPATFQYFSFITLTTVGYGDYTPKGAFGQTIASVEAIFGQVFLVTVVALTVSNLGRELPHRRGLHSESSGDPGEASAVDELEDDELAIDGLADDGSGDGSGDGS